MVNKVIIEFESKSLPAQREGRIPLRLTNDIVFFHVFASDTEQSRKALLSLLNLVLGRKDDPITEILVANSVHKGLQPDEKGIVMDVKAKSRSGEIFIVEMQNRVTEDFKNRVLFYGSRMVNSSLDSGEKYGMMKKSIVIS